MTSHDDDEDDVANFGPAFVPFALTSFLSYGKWLLYGDSELLVLCFRTPYDCFRNLRR